MFVCLWVYIYIYVSLCACLSGPLQLHKVCGKQLQLDKVCSGGTQLQLHNADLCVYWPRHVSRDRWWVAGELPFSLFSSFRILFSLSSSLSFSFFILLILHSSLSLSLILLISSFHHCILLSSLCNDVLPPNSLSLFTTKRPGLEVCKSICKDQHIWKSSVLSLVKLLWTQCCSISHNLAGVGSLR